MQPAHSPLGGSTLKRWSACPGSIRLSKGIPNRSSVYADEGTRAHEVAAHYLENKSWPTGVNPEMLEAVKVYTDFIASELKEHLRPRLWIEQKVSLAQIHPDLYGTADAIIYDYDTKVLKVCDYKHGSGTVVEVEEDGKPNYQLTYYALGAALSLSLPVEEIEIIVVQPRCAHPDGPIRRMRFGNEYLLEFAADLSGYAKATEHHNAPVKAGSHCKFCPAAGICPEIHSNALTLAKEEFSPSLFYDPEKLSLALQWLPTLSAWIGNVREFAYREAQHGRIPPGYKLVPKRATRRWRNDMETANYLQNELNLETDEVYNRVLRSPAQVEKVIKELGINESLDHLIVAQSSGLTLVPESDKRQALKHDVKSDFDVVTE